MASAIHTTPLHPMLSLLGPIGSRLQTIAHLVTEKGMSLDISAYLKAVTDTLANPNAPTPSLYALMSSVVYKQDKRIISYTKKETAERDEQINRLEKQNYNLLIDSNALMEGNSTPGFYAAVFYNQTTKQMVVSFRGTLFKKGPGITEDKDILEKKVPEAYLADCKRFIEKLQAWRNTQSNFSEATLSFTGHSLGGYAATVSAGLLKKASPSTNVAVATFDPLGQKKAFDKHNLPKDIDATHYITRPNLPNTCDEHVGELWMVADKPIIRQTFDDPSFHFAETKGAKLHDFKRALLRLKRHAMSHFFKCIDETTGYFQHIKHVERWPIAHNVVLSHSKDTSSTDSTYTVSIIQYLQRLKIAKVRAAQIGIDPTEPGVAGITHSGGENAEFNVTLSQRRFNQLLKTLSAAVPTLVMSPNLIHTSHFLERIYLIQNAFIQAILIQNHATFSVNPLSPQGKEALKNLNDYNFSTQAELIDLLEKAGIPWTSNVNTKPLEQILHEAKRQNHLKALKNESLRKILVAHPHIFLEPKIIAELNQCLENRDLTHYQLSQFFYEKKEQVGSITFSETEFNFIKAESLFSFFNKEISENRLTHFDLDILRQKTENLYIISKDVSRMRKTLPQANYEQLVTYYQTLQTYRSEIEALSALRRFANDLADITPYLSGEQLKQLSTINITVFDPEKLDALLQEIRKETKKLAGTLASFEAKLTQHANLCCHIDSRKLTLPRHDLLREADISSPSTVIYAPDKAKGLYYQNNPETETMQYRRDLRVMSSKLPKAGYTKEEEHLIADMVARFISQGHKIAKLSGNQLLCTEAAFMLIAVKPDMKIDINGKPFKPGFFQKTKVGKERVHMQTLFTSPLTKPSTPTPPSTDDSPGTIPVSDDRLGRSLRSPTSEMTNVRQ